MNHLADIVGAFSQKRIVVIGDSIADQFIYGEISRVSREAPVFILRHEHTETAPGGAGNCAANLAGLGAQVTLVSVLGNDETGQILSGKLREAGVDCSHVVLSDRQRTTTKVRVLAGQIHSTRQQVIRIDYDHKPGLAPEIRDQLHTSIAAAMTGADAVIISDYNYGVADPTIGDLVRAAVRVRRIPVLVDSRFRLAEFSGFTSATPNEDEVRDFSALSSPMRPGWHRPRSRWQAARHYQRRCCCRNGCRLRSYCSGRRAPSSAPCDTA